MVNPNNNSPMMQVSIWSIVVIIIGCFGWFFNTTMVHENRLTKLETQYSQIYTVLSELKDVTKEIRQEQINTLKGGR